MEYLTILAQAVETAKETTGDAAVSTESIVPLEQIWTQITSLGLLEALTFISFGAVCLLYGWRVFKVLVVICFALAGLRSTSFPAPSGTIIASSQQPMEELGVNWRS